MRRPSRSVIPTSEAISPTRRTISSEGMAKFSQQKASSLATSNVKNSERGSWKTVPILEARSRDGSWATGTPSRVMLPVTWASKKWGTKPFRQRSRVVLPQPESPVTRTL